MAHGTHDRTQTIVAGPGASDHTVCACILSTQAAEKVRQGQYRMALTAANGMVTVSIVIVVSFGAINGMLRIAYVLKACIWLRALGH